MRFGSVCSGIEAASVAFGPLGWKAAWLAEIESFPSAVLAHHYPNVPNLGDMTRIASMVEAGQIEAPDMLCGGTPCQSFSVAGLRRSLDDARGNLSLEFIRIANAIDRVRRAAGKRPAYVLWENVPGVLSTKDNAFGAFLGGLCGIDSAIDEPADGWPGAGVVDGPARAVAWRTLDAQFFGLAQRRKRVFVLALGGSGRWSCADALLPICEGLRWDSAPRREAREETSSRAAASTFSCGGIGAYSSSSSSSSSLMASGADLGPGCETLITAPLAFGGNDTRGPVEVATARNACASASGRMDFESETFLVTHALTGEGFDASEDGTGRGTPLVPVGYDQFNDALTGEISATMSGGDAGNRTPSVLVPIPFDTTQITSATNRCNPQAGDPCHPLAEGANAPAIAFDARQSDVIQYGDKTGPLDTDGSTIGIHTRMRVRRLTPRRLTPRECERLQGFQDDYTLIPFRGKPAADGPRYKALGNSWAVPVVTSIGRCIQTVEAGVSA